MTPFTVTFTLDGGPIAWNGGLLLLDSLLAAMRVAEAERASHPDPWSQQHDLPLARYTSPGGQWVFKASALRPVGLAQKSGVAMTCRHDLTHLAHAQASGAIRTGAARPQTGGGPLKTSFFQQPMLLVEQLQAHGVGDIAAVQALLSGVEHIGARRNHGHGRVVKIDVAASDNPDGWTDRYLPFDADIPAAADMLPDCNGPLRPPYWKREKNAWRLAPCA